MTRVLGTNLILFLFPSGAASLAIQPDLNNVSLRWDKSNPEVTTFGKETVQRIAGLRDWTLDFAGIWNSGGSAVSLLATEMAGSTNTLLTFAPASVTGSPTYSGCGLMTNLTVTGTPPNPVAMSFSVQAGAGSMTVGTVA